MRDEELDDLIQICDTVSEDEYEQLSQSDDYDRQVSNLKRIARQNFTYDQLVDMFALARFEADTYKQLHDETNEIFGLFSRITELRNMQASEGERLCKLVKDYEKSLNFHSAQMFMSGVETMKIKASKRGTKAANVLHDKPGGNRDKQAAIRAAWATGKFKSRDICAEQKCAGIDMSFSAARKALRGTPTPS